jgi:hypothetical protein
MKHTFHQHNKTNLTLITLNPSHISLTIFNNHNYNSPTLRAIPPHINSTNQLSNHSITIHHTTQYILNDNIILILTNMVIVHISTMVQYIPNIEVIYILPSPVFNRQHHSNNLAKDHNHNKCRLINKRDHV